MLVQHPRHQARHLLEHLWLAGQTSSQELQGIERCDPATGRTGISDRRP